MLFVAGFLVLFLFLWLLLFIIAPPIQRLLPRAAHWTTKFRYRDYLPVFLVLAAGIGAAAMAGDAFLDIAEEVHANTPRLRQIDAETHAWARTTHTLGATAFFTTLTLIGTPVGLGILVLLSAALLAMKGRWRWIAYLVITTGIGGLLNLQLKAFFARARPEVAEALRSAHGYSFPSGHAMGAAITFGALAYLALRVLPRWRWRSAALAFACAMIVAIAASRVYLGVH